MDQQTFAFDDDSPNAREVRDEALERVENNNPDAAAHFEHVARVVAARGKPFTTDDVFAADPTLEAHREKRAFGPAMMRLAKEGLIQRVGYTASDRVTSHGRPKALWRLA